MKRMRFCFVFYFFVIATWQPLRAQYNALCWRISGNGLHKPSFLYGTMHTNDNRVFHFSKKVKAAFKKSTAYAMELDPKNLFSADLLLKIMRGNGESLQKNISGDDYTFLDSMLQKNMHVSIKLLDRTPPVLLSAMLEQMSLYDTENANADEKEFLDLYFYNQAKSKTIIGIETPEEQLSALNSLTFHEQVYLLHTQIAEMKSHDKINNDGDKMIDFYVHGQLDSLKEYGSERKLPEAFYKAVVADRNIKMADRIALYIQKESVFVAVGALHLASEDGVVAILRKKGYQVDAWE